MYADTWRFLDTLFARCTTSANITLSALPPARFYRTPSRHIPIGDSVALQDALEGLTKANALGWGAVSGIATRQQGLTRYRRGGKADLCEIPALFADLDRPDSSAKRLSNFALPPSYVVSSGRGLHAYWLLQKPTRDWKIVEQILCGLASCLGGDPAISIAQSLRLPGTVNTKPGRNNILCQIVEHHPERYYELQQFTPFILNPSRAKTQTVWLRQQMRDDAVWESANVGDPNPMLVDEIMACLIAEFGGYIQPNGWLGAYCPCGHHRDRPGKHFGFNPNWGIGVCFGRHGRLKLIDLCPFLRIDPFKYGWVIKKEGDKQIA